MNVVFWVMTPGYGALKMETVCFSETVVSTYDVITQNIIIIFTALRTLTPISNTGQFHF
jgi:hypothetical protein